MVEEQLDFEILGKVTSKILASNPNLVSLGSDGFVESKTKLTTEEKQQIFDICKKLDMLDQWEPSKLRNLTLDRLNNETTARENEINAATNLAQAKTAMLNLLADDAKAWRIILWLVKREMGEL